MVGDRDNLKDVAEEYWSQLEKRLKEGEVLILKYKVIEGLDENLVNEALSSYRDGKPVVQATVHPRGILQSL